MRPVQFLLIEWEFRSCFITLNENTFLNKHTFDFIQLRTIALINRVIVDVIIIVIIMAFLY